MNFSRIFYFAIICFLFIQCSFSQVYKPVGYNSCDDKDKYTYQFLIPAGYKHERLEVDHTVDDKYMYPDGAIVYVTDTHGGTSSDMKTKKYGKEIYYKLVFNELTLEGQDENGLYWKERKFGRIYISYFSVKPEQKPKYDSILLNISVTKKPIK